MKQEQKLKIGQQVKVSNRNQINYSREGKIIEKETSGCGIEMSNIQLKWGTCWYADADLKLVKEKRATK